MKPDSPAKSSAPARRRFMAAACAACAGAAAGVTAAGTVSGTVLDFAKCMHGGSRFDAACFRACLGSTFQVRSLAGVGSPVALTLAQVLPSPFPVPAGRTKEGAFSIDLAGAAAPLTQDTYLLSHPDLGEFIALLVPGADGRTLVGVFDTGA